MLYIWVLYVLKSPYMSKITDFMKTFYSIFIFLCFGLNQSFADVATSYNGNTPEYITTVAESGDGVYSILRKYQLSPNDCNLSQFYSLNTMKKGSQLHVGTSYKLPIEKYKYNGKSIRSTIGIDDWDLAVKIKAYNEKLIEKNIQTQSYLSSKILWVPFDLLNCETKNIESTSVAIGSTKTPKSTTSKEDKKDNGNYIIEPLFGESHNRITVKDNSLKNKVYYLVSGHGGPDPGTNCKSNGSLICEDEYAYDIVLRLARNLMERGATVHVIIQDKNDGIRSERYLDCDYDEKSMGKFELPLNQLRRLEQRSKNINELYKKYKSKGIKEQYAIMLHIDSRSKDKRTDAFFYYYEHGKTSKALADHMQLTFKEKYNIHQKGRGYKGYVKSRNLYMVRNTLPAALYVELGNIRNTSDQKRFLYPENRQILADWLFDGMKSFKY